MHVLIFIGIICAIVGWFVFCFTVVEDGEEAIAWALGVPFFGAMFAAFGWGLWNLTAGIH